LTKIWILQIKSRYFYLFNRNEMRRILVTGADGQLGTELKAAANGDFEWIFTDRDQLDITDRGEVEAFFDSRRPFMVVNCAAYTNVDKAETDRAGAYRINYDGVRFLAEKASQTGTSLIHISTDFVFDGRKDTPYNESDIPSPLNIYGESKYAGARAALESGCPGAIIRTSWLYSPWGHNFVKSILSAASGREEIRVVADQRGCPTSAASLAGSIVNIIPKLIAKKRRPADVYHYCDTGVVSRADFASEIIRQAGLDCRVIPVSSSEYPSAAKRPPYSAMDTSKFTRDFGIVPPLWKQSLAECLNTIINGR
jgi:dTDP-4-dehydrorhamnose reductase